MRLDWGRMINEKPRGSNKEVWGMQSYRADGTVRLGDEKGAQRTQGS
jgi:hypothetical protein